MMNRPNSSDLIKQNGKKNMIAYQNMLANITLKVNVKCLKDQVDVARK